MADLGLDLPCHQVCPGELSPFLPDEYPLPVRGCAAVVLVLVPLAKNANSRAVA
jgi:hypothetical protein